MYEPTKRVRALSTFPVAPDGVNVLYPTEGQVFDVPGSLLAGLVEGGLVEEAEGEDATPLTEIATTPPSLSGEPHGRIPGVSLGGFPRREQPAPAIGVASETAPPPAPEEGEEAPLPKPGPDWSDQVAPAAAEEQGGVPVQVQPGPGPEAPPAALTAEAQAVAVRDAAAAETAGEGEEAEKMRKDYENKALLAEETKEGAPSEGENPEEAAVGDDGEAPSTGRRGRKAR